MSVVGRAIRFLPGPLSGGVPLVEPDFVEGPNVAIDAHYAQTNERLAELAADLVLRRVAVIARRTGQVVR
jgi:hypothetical protein